MTKTTVPPIELADRLERQRMFVSDRQHAEDLTAAASTLRTIPDLEAENARLRAALAQSDQPCVYCTLPAEDWAKCCHGFPGCDRADDAMGCPELGAALERDRLAAQVATLAKALRFYSDPSDYRSPLTGGMGKLWHDYGGTARAALADAPPIDPQPDSAEIARRARAEALDDAVRALRARYDLLHADALARQRGVYLDGSPRRETVPVPADPMAQPFTPVKLGGGTGATSADPVRQGLVTALKEIGALASPPYDQAQDADELRRRIYHIRQAVSSALALARAEEGR